MSVVNSLQLTRGLCRAHHSGTDTSNARGHTSSLHDLGKCPFCDFSSHNLQRLQHLYVLCAQEYGLQQESYHQTTVNSTITTEPLSTLPSPLNHCQLYTITTEPLSTLPSPPNHCQLYHHHRTTVNSTITTEPLSTLPSPQNHYQLYHHHRTTVNSTITIQPTTSPSHT